MRTINEDWLIDQTPDEALRIVAASVGQLRDRTIQSPVAGVLVVTHRFVTLPVRVVCAVLAVPTVGLSLIPMLFAKSSFHLTIRAEPDDGGSRLSIEGRADARTVQAISAGLGVEESA